MTISIPTPDIEREYRNKPNIETLLASNEKDQVNFGMDNNSFFDNIMCRGKSLTL